MRAISIVLAFIATILLISMGLSLAWPDAPMSLIGIGRWLISAFSWAAMYVPLWLYCLAAMVLFPGFHPVALYFLSASVLPFLVIAAYARITSDPVQSFARWPLLAAVGLPAITTTLIISGLVISIIILAVFFRLRHVLTGTHGSSHVLGLRSGLRYDNPRAGTYAGSQHTPVEDPRMQESAIPAEAVKPAGMDKKPRTRTVKSRNGESLDPYGFDPASIDIRLPSIPAQPASVHKGHPGHRPSSDPTAFVDTPVEDQIGRFSTQPQDSGYAPLSSPVPEGFASTIKREKRSGSDRNLPVQGVRDTDALNDATFPRTHRTASDVNSLPVAGSSTARIRDPADIMDEIEIRRISPVPEASVGNTDNEEYIMLQDTGGAETSSGLRVSPTSIHSALSSQTLLSELEEVLPPEDSMAGEPLDIHLARQSEPGPVSRNGSDIPAAFGRTFESKDAKTKLKSAVKQEPVIEPERAAASTHEGRQSGKKVIEFTSVPPGQTLADNNRAGEVSLMETVARQLRPGHQVKTYEMPVEGILNTYPDGQYWIIDDKTRESAAVLRETLAEFNIEAEVTGIRKGPVITMFEILPAPGVKLSRITNLGDNIALRLAASSVRIVAPIPGKHAVGIEVPNARRAIVSLREIVDNEAFKTAKMEIPVVLGKDIAGEVKYLDLASTPHLLIAGATGSGKSVCVNTIILSILYRRTPDEVKLLLIDPKIVELKLYNDIPHLLTRVITEPKRAFQALQYCLCEMERRYNMLDKIGVRDIRSYNRRIKEKDLAQERLPYLVVIVDEFADLMATTGKELEATLARLAAMSRAVGIHLVLATQRPSIDVITGLIKANIPSRIAFMVAGKFDSRIIIDMVGAEKLLGKGDMLYSGVTDPFPQRIQGAFVSDEEVERAVEYVKTLGEPDYIDDEIFFDEEEEDAEPGLFDDEDSDPLFEKALEIVLQQGKASASYIQRRLKIGYNRSARLVELMEKKGIVGPAQGSRPRDLVRNPDVAGRTMNGDSPGRPGKFSAYEDEDLDIEEKVMLSPGRSVIRQRPPLIPDGETVPGQRVTGRDED